ncbi:MAG: glycosyltransferase [Candidatus Tectomicrobia bacterium]|uniref:Glycosyltransferase n=1 Tax=Tectimicrobiota bacterium TaxID=2528274 RepID=A0A933GPF9_UNCTE|nr:glycosyltransferase [Candidatus Tectomicrobia bacterium]
MQALKPLSPSASVIVCTRDRPEKLKRCLDSLLNLKNPPLEIMVVDSCPSSFSTRDLVKGYPVKYSLLDRPGLSTARNMAIREVKGDFLAFTDDDCYADVNWLEKLMENFSDEKVMGATGLVLPLELKTEAQQTFERMGYLRRGEVKLTVHGEDIFREVSVLGAGANMAFRKRVFGMVGRFDEALGPGTLCHGGDDLDMFYRIFKAGYKITYDPGAIVWHQHRNTYEHLRKDLFKYSAGHFGYLFKCLINDRNLSALSFGWRVFWKANLRKWLLSLVVQQDLPKDLLTYKMLGCLAGPLFFIIERKCK